MDQVLEKMSDEIKKHIQNIESMLEDTDTQNDEIIYYFDTTNPNITSNVAKHCCEMGYDVYASCDSNSNVFGGGDKILIKKRKMQNIKLCNK